MPTFQDFKQLDIRTGTILEVNVFEKARKPAYIISIDFGTLGIKKTSAQLIYRYKPEDLVGKQIVAVVNFPPMQIANIISQCLILGVMGKNGDVNLLTTDQESENGMPIG